MKAPFRIFLPLLTAAGACLLAASLATAPSLTCTPFHPNGIYNLGETAGWTVTLAEGAAAPAGGYPYTIKKNNSDIIQSGVLDFSSGKATIETKLTEPAMLYVEVKADPPVHVGAAIAPWKLQPAVPRPGDFDRFWNAKLKLLAKIAANPEIIPTPTNQAGVDLYTIKLNSVGSHVQGYLARPSKEGKFPALVIFQYAGVYALQPATATNRAAEGWLTLDVDSHDIPPNQATGVERNYQEIGNTSRETSYFLKMYLRDARAVDYITSRADWDHKTLVFMGTSMGGQQSLVTAALRPKVTAVIVNEPAGADSNGDLHGRKAGYPNWPSTDPKVMQTALYFDTVNFAHRIKAPVLAALGFIDTTAPPAGIWTAMNQIPGSREVIPMVRSDHNNLTPQEQGAFTERSEEVLAMLLHGGEFKPADERTRVPAK